MKRLTVTLRMSYDPDPTEVGWYERWEDFVAAEYAAWRDKYNLQMESITPVYGSNPFRFQMEEIRIEEGEDTE